MPKGAEILCVQVQNRNPVIWAKVNLDNKIEKRSFIVCGTGFPISSEELKKIYWNFSIRFICRTFI